MPTELTLLGTCRLPSAVGWNPDYSQGPACFWPSHGNLLVRGHNRYPEFCEIKLPSVLDGRLATAVGSGFDPTGGAWDSAWPPKAQAGTKIDGVYGCTVDESDVLTGTIGVFYNVGNTNIPCLFRKNLVTGEFQGYAQPSITTLKMSGPVVELPKKLRDAWGHDAGSFITSGSGTANTCAGPGLFTFKSSNIVGGPLPIQVTTRLDWGQSTNQFFYGNPLKPWSGRASEMFSTGVNYAAAVFPMGDQIAWIGSTAADDADCWYGPGSAKWMLAGQTIKPATATTAAVIAPKNDWYDMGAANTHIDPRWPTAKGYHATKYAAKLWTISQDDLIAGKKNIAEQDITSMIPGPHKSIFGCADPATGRLFVFVWKADAQSYASARPLLLVFKFKTEAEIMQEIETLKAAVAQLETAVNTLTQERDNLRSEVVSLTTSRDAAVNKLAELNLKIDQAQGQA